EDLVVSEHTKGPPDTRGARHAPRVVDDYAVTAADPQSSDARGEVRGARQHVRQGRPVVGDRVDVEEHRAQDVRLSELGPRVTLELRHVPGAIEHPAVAVRWEEKSV